MKLKYLLPFLILLSTFNTFANSPAKPFAKLRVTVIFDTPYAYYENNSLVGYNIDLAKALAAKLDRQTDFLVCPVARCFVLMRNGQADILIDINKTPERQTYLSYLPPYKNQIEPLRFFTRKIDNIAIESHQSLSALRVGVIRGTSFSKQLQQESNIEIVPLNTQGQLIKMLHFGRIDAFLEREESLLNLVEYQQYKDELTISTWHYSNETPSYLAVSKQSPLNNNITLITDKLNELKRDGTIDKIFKTKKRLNNFKRFVFLYQVI